MDLFVQIPFFLMTATGMKTLFRFSRLNIVNKMTERRKSGWFSSVVGNLSGFWSRPPLQDEHSVHNSFTEVQADSDFEGLDRFEDAVSKFSPDKPTTSSNGSLLNFV